MAFLLQCVILAALLGATANGGNNVENGVAAGHVIGLDGGNAKRSSEARKAVSAKPASFGAKSASKIPVIQPRGLQPTWRSFPVPPPTPAQAEVGNSSSSGVAGEGTGVAAPSRPGSKGDGRSQQNLTSQAPGIQGDQSPNGAGKNGEAAKQSPSGETPAAQLGAGASGGEGAKEHGASGAAGKPEAQPSSRTTDNRGTEEEAKGASEKQTGENPEAKEGGDGQGADGGSNDDPDNRTGSPEANGAALSGKALAILLSAAAARFFACERWASAETREKVSMPLVSRCFLYSRWAALGLLSLWRRHPSEIKQPIRFASFARCEPILEILRRTLSRIERVPRRVRSTNAGARC
ncbi:hypothetical protein, conserved in T. vivax [Trypanosoma vivax Y486]|uniref:Uncharacterized protein n=1 Tax=Trypanosoma vivax (strain Y486) TaxID=1055687 RepID=F9WML2_TRYVY|nr:hypothetical protein, conserved in T. vivax [Trypanosoma vivax Y486]|eukprot:CCD18769.1 hypothetical protein, conserved in T. vivax [Trypanosoma vivax Y486]